MSIFNSHLKSKLVLLAVPLCLGLAHPSLAAEPKAASSKAAGKAAAKGQTADKATAQGQTADKATAPRKAAGKTAVLHLSAWEIVNRHVSARGGTKAWRAVQALSMSGKMEAGTGDSVARSLRIGQRPGAAARKGREVAASADKGEAEKQVQLPFTLATQRPNKSRLEIEFAGKTAVQVYDGTNGWKVRPYLNRSNVEPFTPQEAKVEADSDVVDPLIDHAARGTKVELAGVEQVEGRDAYKLKLTTRTGTVKHVWIDARTFLDVKVEGVPRRMDGKMRSVFVYQRDFRSVQGVKVPFVLETVVDGYPQKHRILVEKVAVNPKLAAATFAKPGA